VQILITILSWQLSKHNLLFNSKKEKWKTQQFLCILIHVCLTKNVISFSDANWQTHIQLIFLYSGSTRSLIHKVLTHLQTSIQSYCPPFLSLSLSPPSPITAFYPQGFNFLIFTPLSRGPSLYFILFTKCLSSISLATMQCQPTKRIFYNDILIQSFLSSTCFEHLTFIIGKILLYMKPYMVCLPCWRGLG
jgi:hypothetical protein